MSEIITFLARFNFVEGLSFLMLLLALMISTARTVHQMIPLYQVQSISLAFVTLFSTWEGNLRTPQGGMMYFFVIIPVILALIIKPLLAQATCAGDDSTVDRLKPLFFRSLRETQYRRAMPAWLQSRQTPKTRMFSILIDLSLIALAFLMAYNLIGGSLTSAQVSSGAEVNSPFSPNDLAVSFSLLLLGISILTSKEDMISQVMGLLVMEQGMFLAAVRVVASLSIKAYFILGLFLYTMITLIILIFLLPELQRASGSVELDQQTQLKG